MSSYWEQISGFLESLSSGQIDNMSRKLHKELGRCIRTQGWYDSSDICTYLSTELKSGSIQAISVLKTSTKSNDNLQADVIKDSAVSSQDLLSLSRALYLEMGSQSIQDDELDEKVVEASFRKLFGMAKPVAKPVVQIANSDSFEKETEVA